MPTNLGDPLDLSLADIYYQWAQNLGVTPPSKGLGELLGLLASAGAGQSAQGTTDLSPTNTISADLSRAAVNSAAIAITNGTIQLQAVYLTRGQVVTNFNWVSGSTAGVALTHQWGVLTNSARVVVAATPDATSGAIGAQATITYTLTTPYVVPSTGVYYAGIMVAATTTEPTATGASPIIGAFPPTTTAPILGGSSSTAQTTPPALGVTLTAITATAFAVYIYLT